MNEPRKYAQRTTALWVASVAFVLASASPVGLVLVPGVVGPQAAMAQERTPDATAKPGADSASGSDPATSDPTTDAVEAKENPDRSAEREEVPSLASLAEGLRIDPAKLAGADAKIGDREAFKVIQFVVDGPEVERAKYLSFLKGVLDPRGLRVSVAAQGPPRVEDPERFVAARRVVEAIAIGTGDEGPPITDVEELLLPLLGHGPRDFRDATIGAVMALLRWARAPDGPGAASRAALLERLGDLVRRNHPPSAPLLADVSTILWESDGKLFLRCTIDGLARNHEKHPETVPSYLRELRRRLLLDFVTPAQWQEWWKGNEGRSFAAIFIETQRRLSGEGATSWRQTIRRMRETGDAERLRAEIQAVIDRASTPDMRMAAVLAFGEYAEWIRTLDFSKVKDGEAKRLELQRKVCETLLAVAGGELRLHEEARVRRAALGALRRSQPFLEKGPAELRLRVAELVVRRLEVFRSGAEPVRDSAEWTQRREELIEVALTSGALKLLETQGFLEELLADPTFVSDGEVLGAFVQSLGRIVKGGLTQETADLFLRHFTGAASLLPEADAAKLRNRCVTALNARPQNEQVSAVIRAFYSGLLDDTALENLHIQAVVGLGTLAQAKDSAAFDKLAEVISVERFGASEKIAAIDAIAYIGGREALRAFLPFLSERSAPKAKEKAVVDHLTRKVTGLVRAGGVVELGWLTDELERRAYERDDVTHVGWISTLLSDARLVGHLLLEEKDVGTANGELSPRWRVTLAYVRARLMTTGTKGATEVLAKLSALVAKSPQLAEKAPNEAQALAAIEAITVAMSAVESALDAADAKQALATCATLLTTSAKLRGPAETKQAFGAWLALRWIESTIALAEHRQNDALRAFYEQWGTYLRAQASAAIWAELPASFKDAYLRRVDALLPAAPVTPGESG